MSNYVDNVLIKLRRKYSKDEIVTYLFNKVSNLEIENGKLKSYIDELEHNEESKTKLKKEVIRLHKLLNGKIIQT
jgi:cell shape-determining protein MreC